MIEPTGRGVPDPRRSLSSGAHSRDPLAGDDGIYFAMQQIPRKPLPTGNGNSIRFSVLVAWHTSFGAVVSRSAKK
jgi:hypothetical protein